MPNYLIDGGSHIDTPLSRMALRAFDGGHSNIASALFPRVNVPKQSDGYYVIDPDTWLRVPNTERSPKTAAKRGEWKVSTDTYFAKNYAFGTDYALETLSNADAAIRMRQGSVNFVTEALARDREVRVAKAVTSSGGVGKITSISSGSEWSASGSDPISDIRSGHAHMRSKTGFDANTMVLDRDTLETLRYHDGLRNYIKYTQKGPVPNDVLMELFMVERILVAQGVYNAAQEGQDASLTNIWGNICLLARVEANAPSMQTATLGLEFSWQPEGFPAPMAVERYRHYNPSVKAEVLEAQYFADEKIVAPDLGYLIKNTI